MSSSTPLKPSLKICTVRVASTSHGLQEKLLEDRPERSSSNFLGDICFLFIILFIYSYLEVLNGKGDVAEHFFLRFKGIDRALQA